MKQTLLLGAATMALLIQNASSAVLYQQNFEPPVTTATTTTGTSGFVQVSNIGGSGWQIQGGGGGSGVVLSAGVNNNGIGGSQAIFGNWDHTPAAGSFTYNQYTIYGGVSAPGAGTPPSQIQISLQLYMQGSESANNPIGVVLQNGTNDLVFTPTLTNGQYTAVSFTLNQATNANLFDPTVASNLRVQHGAFGFGFDANNVVQFDNILVQTIPEPSSAALLSLGIAGMFRSRRRRKA